MATVNIRSVKNKEQLLLRELHYNIDITLVSETWVRNEIDDVWIDSSDLNKEPYSCYTANRQNGIGGGLMLICKSNYRVKGIHKGCTRSFDHATWSVGINNKSITVTGIYHPLPSSTSPMACSSMTLQSILLMFLLITNLTLYLEILICT